MDEKQQTPDFNENSIIDPKNPPPGLVEESASFGPHSTTGEEHVSDPKLIGKPILKPAQPPQPKAETPSSWPTDDTVLDPRD